MYIDYQWFHFLKSEENIWRDNYKYLWFILRQIVNWIPIFLVNFEDVLGFEIPGWALQRKSLLHSMNILWSMLSVPPFHTWTYLPPSPISLNEWYHCTNRKRGMTVCKLSCIISILMTCTPVLKNINSNGILLEKSIFRFLKWR